MPDILSDAIGRLLSTEGGGWFAAIVLGIAVIYLFRALQTAYAELLKAHRECKAEALEMIRSSEQVTQSLSANTMALEANNRTMEARTRATEQLERALIDLKSLVERTMSDYSKERQFSEERLKIRFDTLHEYLKETARDGGRDR